MILNEVIHGFQLVNIDEVLETDSTAYEFVHEKSGAKLLYLQNSDDNKVFSITFRTPPADDTGVPHIIEHSTLCGSRKFPLKEPFVELVKGSLNTFLNAMTFPDKTMYPIASCNDKDFHNLMDVYLDAVFYPSMYTNKQILMQEGWHYEIEKPDEPLRYSGVVYNEMKGALSSPDDLLENVIMQSLYPDTTYANESGGNPACIPQLTYEEFLEFHRRYYSPANSYIYLYGDMDIAAQLQFINDEYLSNFDRVEVDSIIVSQPAFKEMKRVISEYPIGSDESTEAKTFLSYNVVTGHAADCKELFALGILEKTLMKNPAAPLRKALVDAGLGKDVESEFNDSICQPYFSITVNGSEADRADKFLQVIRDSLGGLIEKGIDRELLRASMNRVEFSLRENDFGTAPKGLIYSITMMNTWLYDEDPLAALRYEDILEDLRSNIDTGYFEDIARRYILDNPHGALVVMKPSQTMAAERETKMEVELAERKEKMSSEEIQQIIKDTAALKLRQQTPDSPEALATIPLLKISDINPRPAVIPMDIRYVQGTKVIYSDINTNGIAYVNLYFDGDVIPQELLPYGFLLSDLLGLVNTTRHSYEELSTLSSRHTGGIGFSLDNESRDGEPDSNIPIFKVSGKSFMRKLPQLMEIMAEMLTGSLFTDKKRIKELLLQERSEMEMSMLQASVKVMTNRLGSFMSPSGAYAEQGAFTLYPLMVKLTDNFDEYADELIAKLDMVKGLLFSSKRLMVGVTMNEQNYAAFAEQMEHFLELMDKAAVAPNEIQRYSYDFPIKCHQEALLSSSQVQYVGKGANILKLGYDLPGYIRIMETILRYEYFWTKIRIQGGAYGAMTKISQDGDLLFASYRDPNLKETVDVFDGTADYLESFEASEREMVKYIIGTISGIDTPLTPKLKGNAAQTMYIRGTTYADRQKRRSEILNATPADIRSLAPSIRAAMAENNLCVFGNETKIKENCGLFGKLTKIMD